jgi:bacterial leucyl aminopeptidase
MKNILMILVTIIIIINCYPQNNYIQLNKLNRKQEFIDSLVLDISNSINKDSIKSFVLKLQNFKTRFCLTYNTDSVATWINNKFYEIGFTDVQIDSFYKSDPDLADAPNYLQKNIIATIPGSDTPQFMIIIGAHYDSVTLTNSEENAPGADDNASGVAALLEIARIIKKKYYNPSVTIRFITFPAEEIGGPNTPHGSSHYLQKSTM